MTRTDHFFHLFLHPFSCFFHPLCVLFFDCCIHLFTRIHFGRCAHDSAHISPLHQLTHSLSLEQSQLWITLSEKYIQSKQINWQGKIESCFSDRANPDDESLGEQIIKVSESLVDTCERKPSRPAAEQTLLT